MRSAWRVLGWGVGGLLGGLVLVYGVLLAINARDEAPSQAFRTLMATRAARPAVTDADNGFAYLQRLMPPARRETLAARPPVVQALARACTEDAVDCAHALDAEAVPVVRRWLSDETGLLQAYGELTRLPGWREALPVDGHLPSYQGAIDGQGLWLLQAWLAARDGDREMVAQLLEQDQHFWRLVLGNADTLITKTVAIRALERHFAIANLVLRELGPGAMQAVPAGWQKPLGADELDMAGALAGELAHVEHAMRQLDAEVEAAWASPDHSPVDRMLERLGRPFFKPQASLNLLAMQLSRLADASHASCTTVPAAVTAAAAPVRAAPWQWLYNPNGRILTRVATPAYTGYILRVADLEGTRRAALEVQQLRAHGIRASDMAATLAAHDDPCLHARLRWDAGAGAVLIGGYDPRPGWQAWVY